MEEFIRFPLRMPKEMQDRIVNQYQKDNCSSQNEFMMKAIEFYMSYLESKNTTLYLSQAITQTIQGSLKMTENRMANSLFRLSVELNMMMHLLATTIEVTDEELYKLRGRSIKQVKQTRGQITIDDAIAIQHGEPWQD